jgi:uncharacterized protein (UPF0332 family)
MITPEIQHYLNRAKESHAAANVLLERQFWGFSAAQSYYTMFYLAQALLLSKGLTFSSHSAVIAAFGKEFAKTKLFAPKFHRLLIDAEARRAIGHYGGLDTIVADGEATESYQWAEEFIRAVKDYLAKD